MSHPIPFNGLTQEQISSLFAQIACTVDLACKICRKECEVHGNTETAHTFAALETMLSGVGGMADMANPCPVHGGLSDWLLGPDFGLTRGKGG